MRLLRLLSFLFTLSISLPIQAQQPKKPNAADIQLMLEKLNVLGSVLYVAAHPDDENTKVIAYMANEKKFNTAYLSATRGDGGQNLIGSEIRELLGLIRTQELLAARRTDGGQQYFSRANDFGYSKNAEETFEIWNREEVLADFVRVFRKHKPDVVITRFPGNGMGGHGHHTASAILAKEAFEMAADKKYFPTSAAEYGVWQPKRILFNTHPFFYQRAGIEMDTAAMITLDLGTYNPLLGKSYPEIASLSRSMHKSQGFGSTGTRGTQIEYFEHTAGERATDMFAGFDTSWNRVKGGGKVGYHVDNALMYYDPAQPWIIVNDLVLAYNALDKVKDPYWKKVKQEEVKALIKACTGLYMEVKADQYSYTPGDSLTLSMEAINRSDVDMKLVSIRLGDRSAFHVNQKLFNNRPFNSDMNYVLDTQTSYSDPYWLKAPGTLGMYEVIDPKLIGTPENAPALSWRATIEINGTAIEYELPVIYKENDPVAGETYRPLEVTPPVFLNISEKVYVFGNGDSKSIEVKVLAGQAEIQGDLSLNLPEGWKVKPESYSFDLSDKGAEAVFSFELFPPPVAHSGEIQAVAKIEDKTYNNSLVRIEYDHIPKQALFPVSSAKVVKVELEKRGTNVGYIVGSGDEIPASLAQIGYEVTELSNGDITAEKLQMYDAVILGIRAYNTNDRLKFYQEELMEYVKNGGTMIVQYNTAHQLVTKDLGPYPLQLSRDRVTVEEAEVRILKPDHPVMNTPNTITEADFEDWVQERGLYFPNEWDEQYEAILSSNDPGEDPRNGGLLVAKYGKGYYIYSGYSWFRELPAGVPGAYRIFTNMISIGK
ncbi:PIG-L family deacetylase [Reichenbachiella carrageenanivorans]|uniref:PIG-L family deacetylase n=1 Tax=Reichenbachiella carrageenanivorans TaxID=2979869 RepID=A0ABY6D0X4_9BACT|nr:PIG-L family deacetylase [Reichenbachiella carrageenanivorans]UXX79275.1 PIG-L family deacetylase [Reichenbachiella carrageenanivorans]